MSVQRPGEDYLGRVPRLERESLTCHGTPDTNRTWRANLSLLYEQEYHLRHWVLGAHHMIRRQFIPSAFLLLRPFQTSANAWFFFFIPGGLFSGSGQQCVKEDAKVGTSFVHLVATPQRLKTYRGRPIVVRVRAYPFLHFGVLIHVNSRAGIDVPDGYEQKPLTDVQKFQGGVFEREQSSQGHEHLRSLAKSATSPPTHRSLLVQSE